MTAPGEVWVRDGEQRTIYDAYGSVVLYTGERNENGKRFISTVCRSEWDAWAAGAERVEKEQYDE